MYTYLYIYMFKFPQWASGSSEALSRPLSNFAFDFDFDLAQLRPRRSQSHFGTLQDAARRPKTPQDGLRGRQTSKFFQI